MDNISSDVDLYWSIPNQELYNMYEEPKNFTIGSIMDDWTFLQKLLDEERQVVGYDFHKISSVLKMLGEKIN